MSLSGPLWFFHIVSTSATSENFIPRSAIVAIQTFQKAMSIFSILGV